MPRALTSFPLSVRRTFWQTFSLSRVVAGIGAGSALVQPIGLDRADRSRGERAGERYGMATHVSTLAVVKGDGVASLPAGPAATPTP